MAKEKNKDLGDLADFFQIGADIDSPGNIPTGHFKLDFAIQYGEDAAKIDLSKIEGYDPGTTLGIPLGPVVEFFGEEGSGKSSLAYRIVGYAQKLGYKVAWIDVEHSYKKNLAILNGCDINKMWYSNLVNHKNPDKVFYAENIFGKMIGAMKAGVKVIVLDSVANMVPKALEEADEEQQFMGLLARMLSQNLGKLISHAAVNGTLVIFINQLRKNLKVGIYGDPDTSPGGHSLKHNASVVLKFTKKKGEKANIFMPDPDSGEPRLIGRYAIIKIMKNRFAKPFLDTIEIPIYYEQYFPEIEDIVFDTGRQIKLISIRNNVYKWNDIRIEGREGFIDHIVKNNMLVQLIRDIKLKALEDDVILPPEINLYKVASDGDDNDTGQVPGEAKKEDSFSSESIPKKTRRKRGS